MQQKGSYASPAQKAADVARGGAIKASEAISQAMPRGRGWFRSTIGKGLWHVRSWSQRYPPLAAFLISLIATSSLPIGAFTLFATVSLGTLLTVALSIVGVIEGGFLFFAGIATATVLAGCFLLSLAAGGMMTFGYISFRLVRAAVGHRPKGPLFRPKFGQYSPYGYEQASPTGMHGAGYGQAQQMGGQTTPQKPGQGSFGAQVIPQQAQQAAQETYGQVKEKVDELEQTGRQARQQGTSTAVMI